MLYKHLVLINFLSSDLTAMSLASIARDEVLNDLIVSGSNERSKLKYLQKCGSKKRKEKCEIAR